MATRRLPVDDTAPMRHNPFAAAFAGVSAAPTPPESSLPTPKAAVASAPARAVLRLERKGHGGKEMTVVSQLSLPAPELERWLTALKGQLGCGGRIEEEALLFQGDQRDRLEPLLRARGVGRITHG